uniref:Uncharacterized protein n=1 Tax=Globisporangium ultimum (strain ATCC 200006 / CBS 805.95 / DAOM BR144) TaxID=431595 RepID=K3WDT1_GLOUD
MASFAGASSHIDFVRAASMLENGDYKPQVDASEPRNSRQDYVKRRIVLWDGPPEPRADAGGTNEPINEVELGSISRLPLPLQTAFRLKMLSIFALQLLYVWTLVGAALFYPQASDFIKDVLRDHNEYVAASIAAVLVLLVLLYFARRKFPLNWFVLLVFSTAQAIMFAALGNLFDTNLGFFNCGATFSCIVITIILSGVRIRSKVPDDEGKLFSSIWAGLIAYVVVALAAGGLFIKFGRDFVTPEGFGASLGFQFVLIMWFSIDASSMYRVMSPDEYMHGVIYFYTDMSPVEL